MHHFRTPLFFVTLTLLSNFTHAADQKKTAAPERDWDPVELTGKASDYWFTHNWYHYYWREDFRFQLTDEKTKETWKIISREPTPAYEWRMGTTLTGLDVDWKSNPRVRVLGVKALDRIPEEFYGEKLDVPLLATVFVVQVEQKNGEWKDFYVNNWFHKWGPRADKAVHAFYADKKKPYDIYGFVNGQAAPFDKASQSILERHHSRTSGMFHGLVRTAPGTPFGYEIQLLDLVGRDPKTGGATLLHGDGKDIPKLDGRKPKS